MRVTLLLILFTVNNLAYAAPCTDAAPLTKPCAGLLIPFVDAKEMLRIRDSELPLLQAKLAACDKALELESAYFEKTISSQAAIIERLERHIKATPPPKPDPIIWYADPSANFLAGVVVGGGGLVTLFYLAGWTKR